MRLERLLLIPATIFLVAFLLQAGAAIWGNSLGYDLPFHLANGREILSTRAIPHADPFLFTIPEMPPHHFPNYEWLFGVISWKVYSLGGFTGIELFRLLLIAGIFLLAGIRTWTLTESRSLPGALRLMIVTVVLILGFVASGRRFEPRPHLLSGLGLMLFALFLDAERPRSSTLAVVLAFGLVWANCHIEVLLGLGYCIIELFLTTLTTRFFSAPAAQSIDPPTLAPRVWLMIGLFAAIMTSSASWRMFTQAAEYYSRLASIMEKYKFVNIEITPIESGWWHHPFGILLAVALFGLGLGLFSPETRRATVRQAAGLPFWFLPFLSNRYLLPAAIFLIPAAGVAFQRFFERMPQRLATAIIVLAVPLTMAACSPTLANPSPPHPDLSGNLTGTLAWHPARQLPEGAIRFLHKARLGGRIFCPDRWGNILLFSSCLATDAVPLQPFIHNMNQTYSMTRLDEYLRILRCPDEALELLDKRSIDLVLLPMPENRRDEQFHLSRILRRSPSWQLIFWDDLSLLYARQTDPASTIHMKSFALADPPLFVLDEMALTRIASNTPLLEDELQRARIASAGVETLNTSLWLAYLRESRGDREGAISALRDLLRLHPNAWPILAKLGLLLHQNGQESASISTLEQARTENPHHAPTLYNLSVAYFKAGQADLALRRLDESRLADPEFEPAKELEKKIPAP